MPTRSTAVEPLRLYRGDPLVINSHISVRNPRVGDIADVGEENYYRALYRLIATPSDMMAQLDKIGVDWEQISDFDLFLLLHWGFTKDVTSVFFGDLDISSMQVETHPGTGMLILTSVDGTVIDLGIYTRIMDFLCTLHGIRRINRRAGNLITKQAMLEDAHAALKAPAKEYEPVLFPLVSAMVNHPGFKHDERSVFDMSIFAFMDSVRRIQVEENCLALLKGMYSGMIDSTKIRPSDYDWLKQL